jgi:hypothetical protein
MLNCQRPLWESDQEVVKRSGRDEPIEVVIYMCMEGRLGISPYCYPFLKLAETLSFLLLIMSSLQQNWRRGQNRFYLEARGWREREGVGEEGEGGSGGRDDPNNVYTYE